MSASFETRLAVAEGLERVESDGVVKAIIITGAGNAFFGDADIKEFDSPKATTQPNLSSLIRQIKHRSKLVIATVHSVCMSGGLELALACNYRLAAPGTSVALPEVKIDLIPGADGTQRVPCTRGIEAALNMIVSGNPIKTSSRK